MWLHPFGAASFVEISKSSRAASLVFSDLPASQGAITRFAKPLYELKLVPGVRIPRSPP